MNCEDVIWCSIDNWYQLFKKVTFKTVVLPLPNEVLDYLKSDGSLILPKECDEDTDDDNADEDSLSNESEQPSFPEFNARLKDAISRLGGTVFPKLNWSAPRDAAWVGVAHSLKCDSLAQVWILLKSSEFICHDLTQPFKDCVDAQVKSPQINYVIALKKWHYDINPATEFRCYIYQKKLIAVEQRDASNFYQHISDEKEDIVRDIKSFFLEHVQPKLTSIQNVVMDIMRPSKDLIRLIDFNPFGPTTDTVLFDWSELQQNERCFNETDVEFRYIQNQCGIRPNSLHQYSLPKDIVDVASGMDHEKLVDFLQLQANIQQGQESQEDE